MLLMWSKTAPARSQIKNLSRLGHSGFQHTQQQSFLTNSRSALRTRIVFNNPDPSISVNYALPLAFLAAESFPSSGKTDCRERWPYDWVQRFNQQGYSTATIFLSGISSPDAAIATEQLMALERDMKTHMSEGAISFFPPLLFAKGELECLLAQTYVSSNPLSGLVLISPPATNSVPTFNFEPRFPIAIMGTKSQAAKNQLDQHRLLREHPNEVDYLIVDEEDTKTNNQAGFEKVKHWMDNNGL